MTTNEYANRDAIVAAGLSPVPEVGNEVDVTYDDHGSSQMHSLIVFMIVGPTLYFAGGMGAWRAERCTLIRRGSTVIPEED